MAKDTMVESSEFVDDFAPSDVGGGGMPVPHAFESGKSSAFDAGEGTEKIETPATLDEEPSAEYVDDDPGFVQYQKAQEPEPEAEAFAEPEAPPAISDELINMATLVGLTPDQARGFETPDALQRYLMAQLQQAEGQPAQAQQPQPQAQPTPSPEASDDDPFQVKLNPEEYEPALIQELNRMSGAFRERVTGLEQQLQNLNAQNQAREAQAALDAFERFRTGLGEEWQDVLGSQPLKSLTPYSKEWMNNMQLIQSAAQWENAMRQRNPGVNVPYETLFKQVTNMVFADHLQKVERKRAGKRLEKAQSQVTARPTATPQSSQPEDKAVQFARDFLSDKGSSPTEATETGGFI